MNVADELTPTEVKQAGFITEILSRAEAFRPFAIFDEPLDCIRVVWRDCSNTEVRMSGLLTVLEANYPATPGQSEIVGFTMKGVAHMCETHGISETAPWNLAEAIDAFLRVSPPRDRVMVKNMVEPAVQQKNLKELPVEKIAA